METPFKIIHWSTGDPFPEFDKSCGVDTETELITDIERVPRLAYTGVYNPKDNTAYIIDHKSTPIFVHKLSELNVVQYYFNAAFDFNVLNRQYNLTALWAAVDTGRVIDIGVRAQLYELSRQGWFPAYTYRLKDLVKKVCDIELDKGEEKGEEADRLTFSPDKPITESQSVYLGFDCYSTWAAGNKLPKMPGEETHTRGSIVLADIENNGLPVDAEVFNVFVDMLNKVMEKARKDLMSFGFPDPDAAKKDDSWVPERLIHAIEAVNEKYDTKWSTGLPDKKALARIITYCSKLLTDHDKESVSSVLGCIQEILAPVLRTKAFGVQERKTLDKVVETYNLGQVMDSRKKYPLQLYVAVLIEEVLLKDKTFDQAIETADEALMEHEDWFLDKPKVGPRKFMQEHLKKLLTDFPALKLPMTEKTQELKLTKQDMWRLTDVGANDPFLAAYTEFNHARKYNSTYLNRDFIKSDGRVHPRLTNLVRTGRTSCSEPNIQNLPSRDKQWPLKNMYYAPDGYLLCATDFSFVESNRPY